MIINDNSRKTITFTVKEGCENFDILFKQFEGNAFSLSVSNEMNFSYFWNNPGMSPIEFLKKLNMDYVMLKFVGNNFFQIDTEKTRESILRELKEYKKENFENHFDEDDDYSDYNEDYDKDELDKINTLINFFETKKYLDEENFNDIFAGKEDFVTDNGVVFTYSDFDEWPNFETKVNPRYEMFFNVIYPQIIEGIEKNM